MLKDIKEQTEEICLMAIEQQPLALQYVKVQTKRICMEAIKQDKGALRYVKDKTMVSNNLDSNISKKQTYEDCLELVKQNKPNTVILIQEKKSYENDNLIKEIKSLIEEISNELKTDVLLIFKELLIELKMGVIDFSSNLRNSLREVIKK
ncbi:hypothetical protein KWU12_15605 [Clostridioides difficile]|nr:hypothetical protein [Clostridioides difficile]MBY1661654.1 hypothetical protein [Clostridioides difficile]HBF8040557.1 hypothetical protein [Clostridioides difficile]HBG1535075.1 hypothetical protein [Clostridioides difficile]HCD9510976.1 hypothetical protein [Clostridioides difficile]